MAPNISEGGGPLTFPIRCRHGHSSDGCFIQPVSSNVTVQPVRRPCSLRVTQRRRPFYDALNARDRDQQLSK